MEAGANFSADNQSATLKGAKTTMAQSGAMEAGEPLGNRKRRTRQAPAIAKQIKPNALATFAPYGVEPI